MHRAVSRLNSRAPFPAAECTAETQSSLMKDAGADGKGVSRALAQRRGDQLRIEVVGQF